MMSRDTTVDAQSPSLIRPLNLRSVHRRAFSTQRSADEIASLVKFLEALGGDGYRDSAPAAFPGVPGKTTS